MLISESMFSSTACKFSSLSKTGLGGATGVVEAGCFSDLVFNEVTRWTLALLMRFANWEGKILYNRSTSGSFFLRMSIILERRATMMIEKSMIAKQTTPKYALGETDPAGHDDKMGQGIGDTVPDEQK